MKKVKTCNLCRAFSTTENREPLPLCSLGYEQIKKNNGTYAPKYGLCEKPITYKVLAEIYYKTIKKNVEKNEK